MLGVARNYWIASSACNFVGLFDDLPNLSRWSVATHVFERMPIDLDFNNPGTYRYGFLRKFRTAFTLTVVRNFNPAIWPLRSHRGRVRADNSKDSLEFADFCI